MKKADFDELLESVREGGRILRGEAAPRREFSVSAEDMLQVETAAPSQEPQKNESPQHHLESTDSAA